MMRGLLAICAAAALASPATAAVVFSDGFEGETFALTQTSLANFVATTGNVDVVGPTSYGITCASGSGKCIDLDGTATGGPTRLTSLAGYNFGAGDTVRLMVDLSGNQRPGADSGSDEYQLGFSFGGNTSLLTYGFNFSGSDLNLGATSISGFSVSSTVGTGAPFAPRSIFFTAAQAGNLTFTIGTASFDDYGPILDNVSLDITPGVVPEPATWAMLIGGSGMIGAALRRRRQQARLAFAA